MEAIAKHRKIAMSPRKARLVVDVVRNMSVQQALGVLTQLPNKAAPYVSKLIRSAMANLTYHNKDQKFLKEYVYIAEIFVDGGKVLKRIQPASRGRAHPIRKPSCHVTVKVKAGEKGAVLVKEEKAPHIAKKEEVETPAVEKKMDKSVALKEETTKLQEAKAPKAKVTKEVAEERKEETITHTEKVEATTAEKSVKKTGSAKPKVTKEPKATTIKASAPKKGANKTAKSEESTEEKIATKDSTVKK
jgi:large subunit ribosomal protein L22